MGMIFRKNYLQNLARYVLVCDHDIHYMLCLSVIALNYLIMKIGPPYALD